MPPEGVELSLGSADDGVRLVEAARLARRGDRGGFKVASDLLASKDPIVQGNAVIYVGSFATESELLDIHIAYHDGLYGNHHWYTRLWMTEMFFHAKLLWAVPLMIGLFHRMCMQDSLREIDSPRGWIRTLLAGRRAQLPGPKVLESYDNREHFTIEAWFMLQAWRRVVEHVGDLHAPIMMGELFDIRTFAAAQRDDRLPDRWTYESVTGADCSNWHDTHGQIQPLQVRAEIDRFLAEDAHRFQPGKRYFLGQEVPQIPDPRAIEQMNQAIAYIETELQAVKREYLIEAGILEEEEEDEDQIGFDYYDYDDLDNWPAHPNGSPWHRVSQVAQDAVLGEFHLLVDKVVTAIELIDGEDPSCVDFDSLAARLLADAGPSKQLRRLVTLADERPDPRWRELAVMALGGSGLGWALEAAGELMCGLDPETTRLGPPWLHLWRRLWPKLDMQTFKLFRSRDREAIRELIRGRTSAFEPDTVLWAGAPLHLPGLARLLEFAASKEPQAPAEVAALRHVLQTMTGVDLARVWASPEEVDPIGTRQRLDALRGDSSFQAHQPGTRLFFGTLVPAK
ncbi:MAG: hypothetical protein R6X02_10825 [Enhygromyxa sp.]